MQRYVDLSFGGTDGHFPDIFGGGVKRDSHRSINYGEGGMYFDADKQNFWQYLEIPNLNVVDSEVLLLVFARRDNNASFNNILGILPAVCCQGSDKYYYATSGALPSQYRYGVIYKRGSGGQSSLYTNSTEYPDAGSEDIFNYGKYIRLRREGSTVKAKFWKYGEQEPVQWRSVNDIELVGGSVGMTLQGRDAYLVIPFFSYATDGDTAPMSMQKRKIKGVTRKPDNTVLPNVEVRAYLKNNGKLVGKTVSGEDGVYLIEANIYEDQLVTVVGVTPTGEEWKPPIQEVYPTTT